MDERKSQPSMKDFPRQNAGKTVGDILPLREIGWRKLAGNVVLMKDARAEFPAVFDKKFKIPDDFEDLIAYVYIDNEMGLSGNVLCAARIVDEKPQYAGDFSDVMMTLRLEGAEEMLVATVTDDSLAVHSKKINIVEKNHAPSEELAKTRELGILDQFRHPTTPDDVSVILVTGREQKYNEQVWARLEKLDGDTLVGRLLNEPHQELGIHVNAKLEIGLQQTDDGLIAIGFPIGEKAVQSESACGCGDAPIAAGEPRQSYAFHELPLTEIAPDEYVNGHDGEIRKRFETLIQAEAPIEKTWLCNRVRESFGIGRSGRRIQERSEAILKKVPHKTTRWNGASFIWRKDQKPAEYLVYRIPGDGPAREPGQIPCEEIVAAMVDAIPCGDSLGEDDLVREAAKAFGFSRVASRIKEVFEKAMKAGVKKGMLARNSDKTISAFDSQAPEFEFAAGVQLAAGDKVTEGFAINGDGSACASMGIGKVADCVNFFLASQKSAEAHVAFFLETPCTADEEDELREREGSPMHYKVYYSDLLDPEVGMILLDRNRDVLLNDGLISFGFFSNDTQSQIAVDKYKVVQMIGVPEDVTAMIMDLAGVPPVKPVTAWDTISPETPAKGIRVEYEGATIDGLLPKLEEDFGVVFDRYEEDEGPASRVDDAAKLVHGIERPPLVEVEVGSTVVMIPGSYDRLEAMPDDPEGAVVFANMTDTANCIVFLHPEEKRETMLADTEAEINAGIHAALGDNQGLVELGCGTAEDGRRYAYTIVKTGQEPSGVEYCLTLDFEGNDEAIRAQGFFEEKGTTGIRDATVFTLEGAEADSGTWAVDPYDPDWKHGLLRNRSEDEKYDKMFSGHPLSRARQVLHAVLG